MPEGPEVEVLVRHLDPLLRGRQVLAVTVRAPRVVRPTEPALLEAALVGARFRGVGRRGKHLRMELEPPEGTPVLVAAHLGMTGRMFLQEADAPLPRHAAVVLGLDRGCFVLEDPRRFGRFHLDARVLDRIAPDPLGEAFTAEWLESALRGSRQPLKGRLMDQAVAAGVGNIYASEILHRARLGPRRTSGALTRAERERLHAAIRAVLGEAIRLGASLDLDFEGTGSRDGLFYHGSRSGAALAEPERFAVYDRDGRPCPDCGTPIRRSILAGRSTFHCPRCQGR